MAALLWKDLGVWRPPASPPRPGAVAVGGACERYGFLHYAVFGRTNPAVPTYDVECPSDARKNWPDEFVLGRRNVYELQRAGFNKKALNELDNLVIFERFPRRLKPLQLLPSDVHHARPLLAAIRKLAEDMSYAPRAV